MQYITAVVLWTGLATSLIFGTSQGKPSTGKGSTPGLFSHDQPASPAAGDPSGHPSASVLGFGAPAYASAYSARAAAQAPSFGTSNAGFGGASAGYNAQSSSAFNGAPAFASGSGFGGAPAGYASNSGFGGAPSGYAMSSSGPGGAPASYTGEAGNSGFAGAPAALASSSGFGGAPVGYASSSGFAGAPAAFASNSGFAGTSPGKAPNSDSAGLPSSAYGSSPGGMGAFASSSSNGVHSAGFSGQNGPFASAAEGFSGRNYAHARSAEQEGPASAAGMGVNPVPGAQAPHSPAGGLVPSSASAAQYGYPAFASAAIPPPGGSGPSPILGPNAARSSSSFGYASSGFAAPAQASFGPPQGYNQFGSGSPQFAAGLPRFGASPSGAEGLKQIFKPYIPPGSSPGSAIPSAIGAKIGQRKSDGKKQSASNTFASFGKAKAKASSGTPSAGGTGPSAPLKLKNPSRSIGSVKKDLSRKRSRKNKGFS